MELSIYGSLIQAYKVCPSLSWLMTKNLIGNEHYESTSIWRFISQNASKDNKTKVKTMNYTFELIKFGNENIISVEINETTEIIESLVFQILYYIYILKNHNIVGEIKIPKEDKTIKVSLTEDKKSELEGLLNEIREVLTKGNPKKETNDIQYCKNCPFNELCLEYVK